MLDLALGKKNKLVILCRLSIQMKTLARLLSWGGSLECKGQAVCEKMRYLEHKRVMLKSLFACSWKGNGFFFLSSTFVLGKETDFYFCLPVQQLFNIHILVSEGTKQGLELGGGGTVL